MDTCKKNVSNMGLKDAFVFTYDRMRRFQGEWHVERQLMFPACVFLESDDEALSEGLRRSEKVGALMEEYGTVIPVKRCEEMFLMSLCGKVRHLGMSRGEIRDGITRVIEGPLKGMEERICRIDRHKRLARLAVPGEFALGGILAGLEIVKRS